MCLALALPMQVCVTPRTQKLSAGLTVSLRCDKLALFALHIEIFIIRGVLPAELRATAVPGSIAN